MRAMPNDEGPPARQRASEWSVVRLLCICITMLLSDALTGRSDAEEKPAAKEALKAVNDFIGEWKGNGEPEKPRPTAAELWNETVSWAWRFRGDDAWITLEFKNGKYFKSAELRYRVDKNLYQLTAVDKKDKKLVFEGEMKDDYLTLDRVDASTKE